MRLKTRIAQGLGAGMTILAALGPALAIPSDDREAGESARARIPPARVSAVRMGEVPEDPTSFTSVLEMSDFEGEAQSVADVLTHAVGVQVRKFGGEGSFSEVSIRGSTSQQVVVLLDGVRLNTAQTGTVDLSTIPAQLVDRIEVTRGGGAVQWGSDAIGGVINVIMKRPTPSPETAATFSGGSWNTFEASLSHTGPLVIPGVTVGVAAGYDGFRTDGDFGFRSAEFRTDQGVVLTPAQDLVRINNASDRHAGLLRAERGQGDAVLAFTDHLFYLSRGQPGLDFGSGFLGGQNPSAHERRTRNLADLRLDVDGLGDRLGWREASLSASGRIYHRFERGHFTDRMPANGRPRDVEDVNQAFGARASLETGFSRLAAEHLARVALVPRWDTNQTRELDFATGNRDSQRRSRWVVGVFAQDEAAWLDERLTLSPGLRFDWTEGFDPEWVPRLGVVVQPFAWLRLKGNVERSYRVPNLDELFLPSNGIVRGNPNLVPEDALVADVGFQVSLAALGPVSSAGLECAFFMSDIDDSIVFQSVSPSILQATNTGEARIRGVELAVAVGFFDWVDFSANVTWLDSEIEATGAPLPGRPDSEYTLRLQVGPPSGLAKLVVEQHHTSDIPLTRSGRAFVSGRTVYDASLTVDPMRLWSPQARLAPDALLLSVIGRNLSDRSVRDARNFPQPGRSLAFQVESRW